MIAPQLAPGEARALVRTIARCPDPIDLLTACCGGRPEQPGVMLLETAEASASGDAGKSLLVLGNALRLRGRGRQVEIKALDANGRGLLPWLAGRLTALCRVERRDDLLCCEFSPIPPGDEDQRLKSPLSIDALRQLMFGLVDTVGQPSSAPLGVGTLSYDLLGCYEALPDAEEDPLGWPDFEFYLPDRVIWLDHQRRTTTVIGQVFGGKASKSYGDILGAVQTLVETVEGDVAVAPLVSQSSSSTTADGDNVEVEVEVEVDLDDDAYAALVATLQRHIVAGDVFQIVPSRTFRAPCPDPLRAYRRLRALNPSPYMFYICGEHGVLFGASPETALMVDGTPLKVEIRPIAGTRPRGRLADGSIDLDLDSRLETALRLNDKEVAEHMMLVDLARNDVARVSQPGSRRVESLLTVERYSHVMHLVSRVGGQLRRDLDALHAYVATMNMGTLVGAPKIKAAELLRRHEQTKRGPYGGAVGYLTCDGRMDTGIVIRAAVVRDGVAHVRAGAGVVFDSDPLTEAHETRRKADAVLMAIRQARPDLQPAGDDTERDGEVA